MKKTLVDQLVAYLQGQDGYVAGAALSRLEWPKYAYGERRGTHSPRSVIRRLEELVEAKELVVKYEHGLAYYASQKKTAYPKKVYLGAQVFEVQNKEEEEKVRTIQAQRTSRSLAEAGSY